MMSITALKEALTLITPEAWRFDAEFDVEKSGHAVISDVQDVTIARIYKQPNDTWCATDNANFIVLAHEMMPDLLSAADELKALIDSGLIPETRLVNARKVLAKLERSDLTTKCSEPEIISQCPDYADVATYITHAGVDWKFTTSLNKEDESIFDGAIQSCDADGLFEESDVPPPNSVTVAFIPLREKACLLLIEALKVHQAKEKAEIRNHLVSNFDDAQRALKQCKDLDFEKGLRADLVRAEAALAAFDSLNT